MQDINHWLCHSLIIIHVSRWKVEGSMVVIWRMISFDSGCDCWLAQQKPLESQNISWVGSTAVIQAQTAQKDTFYSRLKVGMYTGTNSQGCMSANGSILYFVVLVFVALWPLLLAGWGYLLLWQFCSLFGTHFLAFQVHGHFPRSNDDLAPGKVQFVR